MLVPFVAATNTNFIKSIPSSVIAIPTFEDSNSIDTIVFGLFFFGFIACLSCSAMFHTIKVHSYKVASVGNNLDYAGIVVLITTSMVGIIHYSYSDLVLARYIFLALTSIFGTACMITTWSPKFKTVAWRPFRAGMFITFGLSALLPIGYGLIRFGSEEAIKRSGFWFVLLEGIGYISGALLYASRIPERFSPGSFDLFGQSHQIFHVLVVLSAFSHFKALVQSYIYAHVRSAL
ncbi:DEKNAAC104740 [Brettanomyces naardenensis]|uniref:DEKNAAC104740 n=1 Tax=Brettanomyces naardenensis TaxID=13370 RepID=A0A448YRC0_BRENA|nr:DEKNAAC104740 [Brettanomyces naardenensis]